jgi:GNAT superfamily N-acetyltransferase
MSILYRVAHLADAAPLARFAALTFTQTFGHLYPPEELAIYLSEYTQETYARWIDDRKYALWIATAPAAAASAAAAASSSGVECSVAADGADGERRELVGYALGGPCSLPHADASAANGELKKLYLARSHFGTGVAAHLFDRVLEWLRSPASNLSAPVYIGVWSENYRAHKFYMGKYAFRIAEW